MVRVISDPLHEFPLTLALTRLQAKRNLVKNSCQEQQVAGLSIACCHSRITEWLKTGKVKRSMCLFRPLA